MAATEDGYASHDEQETTSNAFRAVFKKYKRRVPPPDFRDVIDLRESLSGLRSKLVVDVVGAATVAEHSETCQRLGLRPMSEWRVCEFVDRPGLYFLPGLLRLEATSMWLQHTFRWAEPPNTTNLTAHGTSPSSNVLEKAATTLRWTTLGVEYDWRTKEYPPVGRALPDELRLVAQLVCCALGLGRVEPDAAIINYYPPKSTLSPHVDRSERSSAPLVSLSLGQSAVYLTGGTSLSEEPLPIWLRNGDVLVMHDAQRLVYHAVPCVAVASQRERFQYQQDSQVESYLNSSRVNITIRQVNPSP